MSLEIASHHGTVPSAGARVANGLARFIGLVCAGLLKLLALSWRADRSELTRIDRLTAAGKPVVIVFWHGSYLPLFALAAGRPVTVFTSRSFRGRVIAGICKAFGYAPSLLPSGRRGYHHMRKVLSTRKADTVHPLLVAIAVDGPLGPFHKVKPGALLIASRMSAVLAPLSVSSRPNWIITSRWDRFTVPLPFAKVSLHVGEPVSVPTDLGADHGQLSKIQRCVFERLNSASMARQ